MEDGWSKALSLPFQGVAPCRAGLYMGSLALLCYKSQDCSSFPVFFLFAVHTIGQVRSDLPSDQDITRHVNEEPHVGEIQLSWGPLVSNDQGKGETCHSFILALCKPVLTRPSTERHFEPLPHEHAHIFPSLFSPHPLLHGR